MVIILLGKSFTYAIYILTFDNYVVFDQNTDLQDEDHGSFSY